MTLEAKLNRFLGRVEGPLGLAVSGGSDSVALLLLAHSWAEKNNQHIEVATVNHGLRIEAKEECAFVADLCEHLGVRHDALQWTWHGSGNLQLAAREGRYKLLGDWAKSRGLKAVALGHTQDDVAETFLMRLARGSGLNGLAQMQASWSADGLTWLRPLLSCSRAELQAYLKDRGQVWCEDASNADHRFERVRMREALDVLQGLGIDRVKLAQTAARLGHARDALDTFGAELGNRIARLNGPDVVFDHKGLLQAPPETRASLFAQALGWVGQSAYPPRREALVAALEAGFDGQKGTLNGCMITATDSEVRVSREYAAVEKQASDGGVWDGRFQLVGDTEATLSALGPEGLAQCENWRATGLPRETLIASPSAWQEDTLLAAPFAGLAGDFRLQILNKPAFLQAAASGTDKN